MVVVMAEDVVKRTAEEIKERLKGHFIEYELKPFAKGKCVFIRIRKRGIREAAEILSNEFSAKLNTVSAVEHASFFEIIYHFSLCERGVLVNLRVEIAKDESMDSITPLIPGASFIEREIHDLFGVRFEGHSDPRRLILPDDWPEGVCPLRKSYKLERR